MRKPSLSSSLPTYVLLLCTGLIPEGDGLDRSSHRDPARIELLHANSSAQKNSVFKGPIYLSIPTFIKVGLSAVASADRIK